MAGRSGKRLPRSPKVDGYRALVAKYGEERVATAVLVKWLSDDAGDEGFEKLQAMVDHYMPEAFSALRKAA